MASIFIKGRCRIPFGGNCDSDCHMLDTISDACAGRRRYQIIFCSWLYQRWMGCGLLYRFFLLHCCSDVSVQADQGKTALDKSGRVLSIFSTNFYGAKDKTVFRQEKAGTCHTFFHGNFIWISGVDGGENLQNYAIVLGGLELEFMRKLALYLREHLDSRIEVEICSEPAYGTMPENRQAVWMGSEKFLQDIAARDPDSRRIVLGDEEREEDTWLFRFQSREKLCRDIWKKCRTFGFQPMRGVRCGRKNRIALTSDSSVGKLLAFSMVCAQIFGKKSSVLYVNLSEFCGMEELFEIQADQDFSDLLLKLRRGEEISLEEYTGQLGRVDFILPPQNPMILHEMRPEDMERFLEVLDRQNQYGQEVLVLGDAVYGSDRLFASCRRIFQLTEQGVLHGCVKNERTTFLRQCLGERYEDVVEQITLPVISAQEKGDALIEEWISGALGRIAEKCLEGEQI